MGIIIFILGILIGLVIYHFFFSKFFTENSSFYEVKNYGKYTSTDSSYWLLSNGKDKYLFTNDQVKLARNRAIKNKSAM